MECKRCGRGHSLDDCPIDSLPDRQSDRRGQRHQYATADGGVTWDQVPEPPSDTEHPAFALGIDHEGGPGRTATVQVTLNPPEPVGWVHHSAEAIGSCPVCGGQVDATGSTPVSELAKKALFDGHKAEWAQRILAPPDPEVSDTEHPAWARGEISDPEAYERAKAEGWLTEIAEPPPDTRPDLWSEVMAEIQASAGKVSVTQVPPPVVPGDAPNEYCVDPTWTAGMVYGIKHALVTLAEGESALGEGKTNAEDQATEAWRDLFESRAVGEIVTLMDHEYHALLVHLASTDNRYIPWSTVPEHLAHLAPVGTVGVWDGYSVVLVDPNRGIMMPPPVPK